MKNNNTDDTSFDRLFRTAEKQRLSLEWKSHILSKKSKEISKVEKPLEVSLSQQFLKVEESPNKGFPISKDRYLSLIKNNPKGKANVVNYKGNQLNFVSTNFRNLEFKWLWSILKESKPDVIIAQVRPDQLLKNFRIDLKTEDGYFDEKAYLNQLIRKGRWLSHSQDGKSCPQMSTAIE